MMVCNDESAKAMLTWNIVKDRGYFPCDEWLKMHKKSAPYGRTYTERYEAYEGTTMCYELNKFRVDLVNKWTHGPVLDVGCAAGTFVRRRNVEGYPTFGWDVKPTAACEILGANRVFSPYLGPVASISFWDVLEHIKDPSIVLESAMRYVFATIPVYTGLEHARDSKHFWPEEHYHYWTEQSFHLYMRTQGFELLEKTDQENVIGREEVMTYVFERIRYPHLSPRR